MSEFWVFVIFAYAVYWLVGIIGIGFKGAAEFLSKCKHGVRENKVCDKCESERRTEEAKRLAYRERQMRLKSESKQQEESERRRVINYYTSKLKNLKNISPKEFEATISRLYTKLGYETELTQYVGDEGKDIIAKINGKTYFIECKQFCSDNKVSRPYLQKLFGAMAEHKVDGGILVTTSEFSAPAVEYANRVKIELVSKQKLREMFQEAYGGKKVGDINLLCKGCGAEITFKFESDYDSSHKCDCGTVTENNLNKNSIERILNPQKNKCVKCGSKMKLINGPYGDFFGCSRYPKCEFTAKTKGMKQFKPSLAVS